MLKLKLQYLGHLMERADSFEKTLMLGKIEGRRRRGRQDEMVGSHHRLNGHGFGWTLGVGDGQGGLVCCNSWGHKESDMTEWLKWTELSGFGISVMLASKWVWECFLFSIIWKSLRRVSINSFLNVWSISPTWGHLVLGFSLSEGFWLLIQSLYLLFVCSDFLFLYDSDLVGLYLSKNLSIFYR